MYGTEYMLQADVTGKGRKHPGSWGKKKEDQENSLSEGRLMGWDAEEKSLPDFR